MVGVSSRVTQAIIFGTATGCSIKTTVDASVWASVVTATARDSLTGPENSETRNGIYFPTPTSVVITGNGTITSGNIRVVVEYTRPALASGA